MENCIYCWKPVNPDKNQCNNKHGLVVFKYDDGKKMPAVLEPKRDYADFIEIEMFNSGVQAVRMRDGQPVSVAV